MDARDIVCSLEHVLHLAKRFDAASDAGEWDKAVVFGMGMEHTIALLHRTVGDTVDHCIGKANEFQKMFGNEEE